MRQPKEKARRCSGGLRDGIAGIRLAHDTPTPPGWMFVLGDSDAFGATRRDRSIGLLLRADAIVGGPHPVRCDRGPRCIVTVAHRGELAQVRADDDADSLALIIASRRIGGAR